MNKLNLQDLLIFENEDFFALNKPPHVSTLSERTSPAKSLLDYARDFEPNAQACHRLDKETSGVILFARHAEAYRHASIQFERRKVTKVYHAVANGLHDLQGIQVYLPLTIGRNNIVYVDKAEGKEAETIFNTLKAYRKHTLVECMPITGRMHQIRVHLSVLGAPIVGDAMYGGADIYLSDIKHKFNLKKDTDEQPLIGRVALHARSLNIELLDGQRTMINAEYPKDIRALINQLERNS